MPVAVCSRFIRLVPSHEGISGRTRFNAMFARLGAAWQGGPDVALLCLFDFLRASVRRWRNHPQAMMRAVAKHKRITSPARLASSRCIFATGKWAPRNGGPGRQVGEIRIACLSAPDADQDVARSLTNDWCARNGRWLCLRCHRICGCQRKSPGGELCQTDDRGFEFNLTAMPHEPDHCMMVSLAPPVRRGAVLF
jgi:hypothetical protein